MRRVLPLVTMTAWLWPALGSAVSPQRSFHRLVTSNGWAVASFDRARSRIDTFLEHPYRFRTPRNDPADLCFAADESRDLAHDTYLGIRSGAAATLRGEWLGELPLDGARYLPGTGIIEADQHAGAGRALRVRTYHFMPMDVATPALVILARVDNVSATSVPVSVYGLFNFHLGLATGGREPSADAEEVSWDDGRAAFYEYGPSQGTIAYVALSPLAHRTASAGGAGAYESLRGMRDLDDVTATAGPTNDVSPGFQGAEVNLAAGATTWFGVAVVWAANEDAGPEVDKLLAWTAGKTPPEILAAEEASWSAWHRPVPAGLSAEQQMLWRQSAAILRMGQVRETGSGFGQILASLPPGLGNIDSQWNISWVRDMAYAVAGLARAGHLNEARDALAFQVTAGPGRHTAEVGMPYRISITRYFGDGKEESDCNADGPNIEFDGFGLFLWSLGEYLRAGGDVEAVRPWWPTIRAEIADVLVSLVDTDGTVKPDSSIWEVHWNGRQRKFTYTSLAAARGLCDAAMAATLLGETSDASRYQAAGIQVRDAVVARHTDRRGALAQSGEDLAEGHHYVDAATVEALNWGVVDPTGRVAGATLNAITENLRVASGNGFMRNDDGDWYDSQEWVFVDFRIVPALRAAGRNAEAEAMMTWLEGQALANDLQFSELHEAATADYAGSIPMVGFGAGAYLLARSGGVLPGACGAYAADPPPPDGGIAPADGGTPDAGTPHDGGFVPSDAGPQPSPTSPDRGCGCSSGGASGAGGAGLLLLLFALAIARRRRTARWGVAGTLGVALVALLFVACSNNPSAPAADAGLPDGGAPSGRCTVSLTYRATDSVPRVFVAGDWNGFSATAQELRDDGSGTYRIDLSLTPGLYAYKLVVEGDGREPWRLDPANPYRTYSGGVENSGLRVADCTRGALLVESASALRVGAGQGRVAARLRYDARQAAPLAAIDAELRTGTAVRALSASEARVQGDLVLVDVAGLPDGKHTVRVVGRDTAGRETEPLLLPVWVEERPFSWDGSIIYMVMTDRFRDGDASNNPSPSGASTGAEWAGGDLQGVTAAIREGYFDALGARVLWLTPFNRNPQGVFTDADESHLVSGYHGYWPIDPLEVEPRLGGAEALAELVEAAHQKGIRVLMDLVVNHVHEQHPYVSAHPEWFNPGCVCGTANCDWTVRRLDCLFRPYLPDVNWQNPQAGEQFIADALEWMERFDLDGFRVDAVKHVADGAIFNLGVRVREKFETAGTPVFLMGETAMGWDPGAGPTEGGNVENYGTISRYIGPHGLSGQFDFVLYYAAALQFLNDDPGRGMAHIDFWTRASERNYPAGAVMTPYLGSHDTPRFMTLSAHPQLAGNKWSSLPPQPDSDEPYDRMYVAFGWLLAIPGAPLLYAGDEYGEYGAADPDNRHMMRFGGALGTRESRQLERIRRLGRARAELPGLRSRRYRPLFVDDSLWVVARGEGDDLVVAVVHTGAQARQATIAVPAEVAPTGRMLADALESGTTVTVERAAIELSLGPRSVLYLRSSP